MAQNKLDFTQEDIIGGVTGDMDLVETAARRLVGFSRMQYEREKSGGTKVSDNQFYARLNNVVRQTIEEKGVELVPDDGVRMIDSPVNTFSNISSYVTAYYMVEMKDERLALPKEAQNFMELFTSAHPVQLNLDDMFEKMITTVRKLYEKEGPGAFSNPDTVVVPDFYIPPLDITDSNGEKTRHCKYMHFFAPGVSLADADNFALGPTVAAIAEETVDNIENMEIPGFTFAYEETVDSHGRKQYSRVGEIAINACGNKIVADMGAEHRRVYDELVDCVKAYENADADTRAKMRNNAGPYKFRQDYFAKNPNGSLYELSLIELQKVINEKSFGIRDARYGKDDDRADSIKYNRDFNVYYKNEPAQFIDVNVFRNSIRQQLESKGFGEVSLPQIGGTVNPAKFLPEYDSVRSEIVSRLSDIKGKAFECSCDVAKGVDIRNEIAAHMPDIVVNGDTYRIPLEDTFVNVYKVQYDAASKKNVATAKIPVSEYIEHPEKYPGARVMFTSNVTSAKIDLLTSRVLSEVYSPENIDAGKVALRDNPYDYVSGKVTYDNLVGLYNSPRFIADEDALERVGVEVESLADVRSELVVDVAKIQKEIYSKIYANETANDAFHDETHISFNGVDFGTVKDMMVKYHEWRDRSGNYYHEGSGYQETAAKITKEVVRKLSKSELKNDNLKPIVRGEVDESYKNVKKLDLLPIYDQVREIVRDCRENPDKYKNAELKLRRGWTESIPGKMAVVGVDGAKFEVNIPAEYENPEKEDLVVFRTVRDYGEKYVKEYGFQANFGELWSKVPKVDSDLMFSDKWRKGVEGTVAIQTAVGRDVNGNPTVVYTSVRMPGGKVFYPNMDRFPDNFGYNPRFFTHRRGTNELAPVVVSPNQAYEAHTAKGIPYERMGLSYELAAATDSDNGFVRDADGVIDVKLSNEFRKNMGVVRDAKGKVDVLASNVIREKKGWPLFPTLGDKPLYSTVTDVDLLKYAPLKPLSDSFKESSVSGYGIAKSDVQLRREAFYRESQLAEAESSKTGIDFVNLIDETFREEQYERADRESADTRDVNSGKEYAGGMRTDKDMYVYIPCETPELRKALLESVGKGEVNPVFAEAMEYGYRDLSDKRVSLKGHYELGADGQYHVSPTDRAALLFSVIAERYPKSLDSMLDPNNPAKEKDFLDKKKLPANLIIGQMQPGIKALGDYYSAFDPDAFTSRGMSSGWIICNRDSLIDSALGVQLRLMAARYSFMEDNPKLGVAFVNKMSDERLASSDVMKYFNSLSTSEVMDIVASQAERLQCYEITGAKSFKGIKGVEMASPAYVKAVADLMDKNEVLDNHTLRFSADELRQQAEAGKNSKYAIKLTQSEALRILEGSLALRGISDRLSEDVVRSVKNIYAAVELKNNSSDKRWDNKVMDILRYRVDETAITPAQKTFLKLNVPERDLNVLTQDAANEIIKVVKTKQAASVENNKKELASSEDMKIIVNGGVKINNFSSYTKADFLDDLKRIPPTFKTKAEIVRRCLEGYCQAAFERNKGIPGSTVSVSESDCRRIIEADKNRVIIQNNSLMTEAQQEFFKRFDIPYESNNLPDFKKAHVQIVDKLCEVGCVSVDDAAYLKQDNVPTINFNKLYAVKNEPGALEKMGSCVASACSDDKRLANQYVIDIARPVAGARNIRTMAVDELKLYQNSAKRRICSMDPVIVAKNLADKLIASDFSYKDCAKGEGKNAPENLDKEFVRVINDVLPVNPSVKGTSVESIVKLARENYDRKHGKENTIDKNRGNDGQGGPK